MRRINSEFQTRYMSEEGQKLSNRDYFGFVEMDDFACYVLADSLDGDIDANSARFVVESLIRSFVEHPTLGKGTLRRYIHMAHKELQKVNKGMRLKAAVNIVVTDYKKLRCCYAGNSRFYLVRNNRFLFQTRDQSLTQNLIIKERLPLDQAAAHEERNNLYSYLGERGKPDIQISKKIKLESGDILAQLTRGVWERCSDEELMSIINDAKEPKDILEHVEDMILGQQEKEGNTGNIDNYSLAVTFVQKVYQKPKKRFSIRQVLMIAIPIILVVGGVSLGIYLRQRNIKNKEQNLVQYMDSGETYLRYDNYKKASEDYTEAKKLASSLKKKEELTEADQYLKLSDQIILADEAMLAGEYKKAQELYLMARELSVSAGNVGKKYIDQQLEQTRAYIDVYDLIALGEEKEAYGDMNGAISSYKQARDKAASLYYAEGKEEALKKQAAAEEKTEISSQKESAAEAAAKKESEAAKEKEEEAKKESEAKEKESLEAKTELENQQKANDQKNAIDLENKGNELLAAGQYDSAITYYKTAQSIYIRLELTDLADGLNDKIRAANAGLAAERETATDAQNIQDESQNIGPGY